jgi:dUTP pyrophosphatase
MRSFEFARKMIDGKPVMEPNGKDGMIEALAYPNCQLPEYQTKSSACADFFCAKEVVIPSIWKMAFSSLMSKTGAKVESFADSIFEKFGYTKAEDAKKDLVDIVPTIVHTGVKACMEDDEVLEIYTRSSNPKKLGLVLANATGVIDKDYYNNPDNDGEIMFAFYNFKLWDTTLKVGDRIGQGMFQKYLRPKKGLRIKDADRTGGFGSTDEK